MEHDRRPIADAALRGIVAAMAMSGLRTITKGLGLVPKTPPEEIFEEGVPRLLARIPAEHREEAIELAHWSYGALGGAVFSLLPAPWRRHALAGPLYGVATWAAFERVLAPVIGIRGPHERHTAERLAVLGDHVLYGVVVAGRSGRR